MEESFLDELGKQASFQDLGAMIQLKLGEAYSDRIRGDRAENFEQAVEHISQAPEVYT